MTTELLTLRELSSRLSVPQQWLRQQAEDGAIPSLRAGNSFLFRLDAVSESLAEQAGRKTNSKGTQK